MSRRQTIFRSAVIAPQTVCNYVVYIPSVVTSPFVVENATLPFAEIESKTVAIRGVSYSVPVKRKAQGSWTCTLVEGVLLTSLYQSLYKMHSEYATKDVSNPMTTSTMSEVYSSKMKDIYIYITDGLGGVVPMLTCVLKNCFLTKINPINLDAGGATTTVKVQLSFQYNDIVSGLDLKGIKDPMVITAVNAAKLQSEYGANKGLSELLK